MGETHYATSAYFYAASFIASLGYGALDMRNALNECTRISPGINIISPTIPQIEEEKKSAQACEMRAEFSFT